MDYSLKRRTERFQQMEDKFRRHHQPFAGSGLISQLRKIGKTLEYEPLDDLTLRQVQLECSMVFREAELQHISYILPNSIKPRPHPSSLAQMTDTQRMEAMPPAHYVVVKGISIEYGDEPGKIAYMWDLQHLHGNSNFLTPVDWAQYEPKPLTCTKGADLYFWMDEDYGLQVGVVTAVGNEKHTWSSDFDHGDNETLQLAQLCLRLLGVVPWPDGESTNSLLP